MRFAVRSTLLGALAIVAVACSGSGAPSASPTATPNATLSAAPSAAPTEEAATYTLEVAQSSAGAYLAGEDGKALYVLTTDSANATTCVDACATTWPPLILEGAETAAAGTGVTGTIATFARPDGSMQVSVGGMPVYYFAGDLAAGDINGQGVGGVWFLAGPDGSAVGAAAASTASPTATESTAAGDSYTIALMQSADGAYLAGEDGKSLYVLTADSANTSTCTGACASNWPAFVLEDGETAVAGDGVTGTIATFARADGSMQVSVNGQPVYYFAGDQAAGDTNGQGINGVWFLAGPDGTPVGGPSASGGQSSDDPYYRGPDY